MANKSTKTVQEKYNIALNTFIEQYEKDKNVLGILVSGSFTNEKKDKNSDIDLDIIVKENNISERGSTWVNGVEIEYFINSADQVKNFFSSGTKDERDLRSVANFFAKAIVIHQKDTIIDDLIEGGKKILKTTKIKMSKKDIEIAKYILDDLYKDLEDVFENRDFFAFDILASDLLEQCFAIFFRLHGRNKPKVKYMRDKMKKLDSKFAILAYRALSVNNKFMRLTAYGELVEYLEFLCGGKRADEWNFKSEKFEEVNAANYRIQ